MDDGPITVDMKPMPDGPYAVTKLVGERLGQSLARAFDLTFIAFRLGWIQEGKNRPETLPHDWAPPDVALERRPDPPVRLRRRGRDRRPLRSSWSTACLATTECAGTSPTPPSCSATSPRTTPSMKAIEVIARC